MNKKSNHKICQIAIRFFLWHKKKSFLYHKQKILVSQEHIPVSQEDISSRVTRDIVSLWQEEFSCLRHKKACLLVSQEQNIVPQKQALV